MTNILAVSPHPDDVELGCGGYLARQHASKALLVICGADYEMPDGRRVLASQRRQEQDDARKILDITACIWWDYKDQTVAVWPERRLVSLIDEALYKCAPVEMLIPLPSSNGDHTVVFNACITACRHWNKNRPIRLIAYEQPYNCWGPQPPDWGRRYIVLREDDLERKHQALLAHASQNYEGKDWGTTQLAAMRGWECGAKTGLAELQYVVREIV